MTYMTLKRTNEREWNAPTSAVGTKSFSAKEEYPLGIKEGLRSAATQILQNTRETENHAVGPPIMLQFPAFMLQFPSPTLIPSSTLLPVWAVAQNDEILLAMEESELEDKLNEIRTININAPVIGKAPLEYRDDVGADAEDDDDADHAGESEGSVEYEQETG